jgi:hypothetical protein
MDVVTLGVVVEEGRRIGPKRFELCPLSLTMDMRDASGQDGVEQGPRSSLANIALIGPARTDLWLFLPRTLGKSSRVLARAQEIARLYVYLFLLPLPPRYLLLLIQPRSSSFTKAQFPTIPAQQSISPAVEPSLTERPPKPESTDIITPF